MNSFSIRKNLASVAVALLLATPTSAAPPRLMSRSCLSTIVSDLSCADSSIMTRCIAIETVDAELLATCLEAAGCTPDEAENALWITEKCQTSSSKDDAQPDREGELRRRSLHGQNKRGILGRADTTTTSTEESTTASATATSTSSSSSSSETSSSTSTSSSSSATSSTTGTSTSSSSTTSTSTTSSASATSTSSSSSVNIGLSSAIVGTTLAIAAVAAFGGVFICAWREGASKRKAKREAAQKEALLGNPNNMG